MVAFYPHFIAHYNWQFVLFTEDQDCTGVALELTYSSIQQ